MDKDRELLRLEILDEAERRFQVKIDRERESMFRVIRIVAPTIAIVALAAGYMGYDRLERIEDRVSRDAKDAVAVYLDKHSISDRDSLILRLYDRSIVNAGLLDSKRSRSVSYPIGTLMTVDESSILRILRDESTEDELFVAALQVFASNFRGNYWDEATIIKQGQFVDVLVGTATCSEGYEWAHKSVLKRALAIRALSILPDIDRSKLIGPILNESGADVVIRHEVCKYLSSVQCAECRGIFESLVNTRDPDVWLEAMVGLAMVDPSSTAFLDALNDLLSSLKDPNWVGSSIWIAAALHSNDSEEDSLRAFADSLSQVTLSAAVKSGFRLSVESGSSIFSWGLADDELSSASMWASTAIEVSTGIGPNEKTSTILLPAGFFGRSYPGLGSGLAGELIRKLASIGNVSELSDAIASLTVTEDQSRNLTQITARQRRGRSVSGKGALITAAGDSLDLESGTITSVALKAGQTDNRVIVTWVDSTQTPRTGDFVRAVDAQVIAFDYFVELEGIEP